MATPQYNIKTGSDSSAYFSREVTISDPESVRLEGDLNLGLIKKNQDTATDYFEYPVLVRRTGDSFKGTTETIESNELRKGRTKSAPRQGNSSSEGSLDFEFSPETYDDILSAAFRNEWENWVSDKNSATNLDGTTFNDGYFSMKKLDSDGNVIDVKKRLFGTKAEEIAAAEFNPTTKIDEKPLIVTEDAANLEVAELTCGTKEIKYDVIKEFAGSEAALYQDFEHLAVNTIDMSVTPGQIVTGSFGFMGSNNPRIVQKGTTGGTSDVYTLATSYSAGTQYYSDQAGTLADPQPTDDTEVTATPHYTKETVTSKPTGLIKELCNDGSGNGRLSFSSAATKDTENGPATIDNWIDNFPKKGTSTDQYTAREGFLYIDGERVRYGSNLSFNLNNGLEKTFAIFEKDAIAISPLQLDITGSLGAYLIAGYTETLYNLSKDNKDVEVIFCFQDKEENPDTMYVVQIFKTKFTDADISSGAENLECTFPFQSFEERAMRILRIRRKKVRKITDGETSGKFNIELTTTPDASVAAEITATATLGTESKDVTITDGDNFGKYVAEVADYDSAKDLELTITYNGVSKVFVKKA